MEIVESPFRLVYVSALKILFYKYFYHSAIYWYFEIILITLQSLVEQTKTKKKQQNKIFLTFNFLTQNSPDCIKIKIIKNFNILTFQSFLLKKNFLSKV